MGEFPRREAGNAAEFDDILRADGGDVGCCALD